MFASWIAGALVLGLGARRVGLPPLVGFLVAGFAFSAVGGESSPLLSELADAGVLLLLFGVGLKLRLKTLFRFEVWGTAIVHLIVVGALLAVLLRVSTGVPWAVAGTVALALGFSSTVLAAKALEAHRELRALHGRVAIGILITQDLLAVVALSSFTSAAPSPYALLLLLLPLLRPVVGRMLDHVDHGELLVLFGAALAIAAGGAGFEHLGLSPELGALLLGTMLSGHARAEELSHSIWGLKEFLLVGFFLDIGLSGTPDWQTMQTALWLTLLLPLKAALFFGLLVLLGLRARTSFLTSLALATFSEFGLIVLASAVDNGLVAEEWLVDTAVAVALSFAVAAPLNAFAHPLYARCSRWLEPFERDTRHLDDEPISLGSAEILIVGMGRLGTGAYNYLREQGRQVVGTDSDLSKVERHRREGRRVLYADAEDASFWRQLNVGRLRAIMLAFPELDAKRVAARELRARGYTGLLSATHVYDEERAPILEAGCNVTYNYFTEAGVGFARDTWETLQSSSAPVEPTT